MAIPKDIEAQLQHAIKNSGFSRYRLAQITGVSEGLLSNFMSGKRTMTLTTAARLAKALKMELRHIGKKD